MQSNVFNVDNRLQDEVKILLFFSSCCVNKSVLCPFVSCFETRQNETEFDFYCFNFKQGNSINKSLFKK